MRRGFDPLRAYARFQFSIRGRPKAGRWPLNQQRRFDPCPRNCPRGSPHGCTDSSALSTWAQLFDNSTPNDGGAGWPRPPPSHSSEAEWSGDRLLTGFSKVRFLPLELVRARVRARALAARWREHPPRKREAPVRFRTRAPSCPCRPTVRMPALQAGDAGSTPTRGTGLRVVSWSSDSARLKPERTWCDSTATHCDGTRLVTRAGCDPAEAGSIPVRHPVGP